MRGLWQVLKLCVKVGYTAFAFLNAGALVIMTLSTHLFLNGRTPFRGVWGANALDGASLSLAMLVMAVTMVAVFWTCLHPWRVKCVSGWKVYVAHLCLALFVLMGLLYRLFPLAYEGTWVPLMGQQVIIALGAGCALHSIWADMQPPRKLSVLRRAS